MDSEDYLKRFKDSLSGGETTTSTSKDSRPPTAVPEPLYADLKASSNRINSTAAVGSTPNSSSSALPTGPNSCNIVHWKTSIERKTSFVNIDDG